MKHFSTLILLLFPVLVFCENDKGGIKIFIENAEEDEIFSAQVEIMDGERMVAKGTTDSSGFLYLANIDSGTYILIFREATIGQLKYQVTIKEGQVYELRETLKSSFLYPTGGGIRPILGSDAFMTTYGADDILGNPSLYRN